MISILARMLTPCQTRTQVMASSACYQADRPLARLPRGAFHVNISIMTTLHSKMETAGGMRTRWGQSERQRSKYEKKMESPV